jgi:S-adenosylmethionine-diacylglycerol 3-amino-3-carboxypropyl transferase
MHLSNVSLDFVRYANLWEDAQVLREGLRIQSGDRVLSIGSGGDNCFALLLDDPSVVVAADLNPAQLHLIELKIAAIRTLKYPDLLHFLGFTHMDNRATVYEQQLASQLSETARAFWDAKSEDIALGVIHTGKFERYFQMFSRKVLPFIHSKRSVEALLAPKSAAEQADFYHKKWNTWRWRALFKLFFSKTLMGWLGRDPAFLNQVQVNVGEFIFNKAAAHLSSVAAQQNHILRYNLTGSYGHLRPDYLADEATVAIIRERLDRIQLFQGFAQTAEGPFNAMNLSDIFEYMDDHIFAETGRTLGQIAAKGCRIAYWNLMVPRHLAGRLPDLFASESALSAQLTAADKGFFYSQILVDIRH